MNLRIMSNIKKEDLYNAKKSVMNHILKTPFISSWKINKLLGSEIIFKCENRQITNSFKIRGVYNFLENINANHFKNGVITHSSGNHGIALSYAAKELGIKSYTVMPSDAPKIKIDKIKENNSEIFFSAPSVESRKKTTQEIVKNKKLLYVPSSGDPLIICGQSTIGFEMLEFKDQIDVILAPVGGGGLLSGLSLFNKFFLKKTKIFGIQSNLSNDAFESFYTQKLITSTYQHTIADGLRTSLSKIAFEIIAKHTDDILCVKEESIIKAMKILYQEFNFMVEGSAAVTFAALIENQLKFKNKKIVIILSGGNIDTEIFMKLIK
jgi:threonine dehydratase